MNPPGREQRNGGKKTSAPTVLYSTGNPMAGSAHESSGGATSPRAPRGAVNAAHVSGAPGGRVRPVVGQRRAELVLRARTAHCALSAILPVLLGGLLLAACRTPRSAPDLAALRQEVIETERAFAATMARRDHMAFVSFLSEEAVFFSGERPLRGKQAVADYWLRFFEKPEAPFSWQPEHVDVLNSGKLALSFGPVCDASGQRIGIFTSVWRREAPGTWRIIFDKGDAAAPRTEPPK